jgi:hypothetical protein
MLLVMVITICLVAGIILCGFHKKGDVSASMSLWRILEFKLDAKEKRR